MPRTIIDTESSRPAYVRRQLLTSVIVVAVVALVILLAFEVWASKRSHPAGVNPASSIVAPARPASSPGT
ncbi:MAG: hypothetical protein M3R35_03675 [Candidatus Eremiobacteraeota bacterium]|nr:hypothetical protein [Candidatus Eremiobacteraeota bacterium]